MSIISASRAERVSGPAVLRAHAAGESVAAHAPVFTSTLPETRIGPLGLSAATCTEVLGFVSGRAHRTSGIRSGGVTADLCCFQQEDPAAFEADKHLYRYVWSNPLLFADPTGEGGIAVPWSGIADAATLGYGSSAGLLSLLMDPGLWLPLTLMSNNAGGDETLLAEELEAAELSNKPCKDPCRGLWKVLIEHLLKLAQYKRNPHGHDNLGLLANAPPERQQRIFDGRVRHLQQEIETFRKQLIECLKKNG